MDAMISAPETSSTWHWKKFNERDSAINLPTKGGEAILDLDNIESTAFNCDKFTVDSGIQPFGYLLEGRPISMLPWAAILTMWQPFISPILVQ